MTMKLATWNVNGLRSVLDKGFPDFIQKHQPDIVCLQETKVQPDSVDLSFLQGYELHFNPAEQKGYSGVAVFTKSRPRRVAKGIGQATHDQEGRVLTLEFPEWFLVNCYTPNSQRELLRLDYRLAWDEAFRGYVCALAKKKPVLFCGDLNVAHQEIDLANPKSNRRNAGFTDEERQSFSTLLAAGFHDVFRELDPSPQKYTWWTYRGAARAKNIGWRLDYWCASPALRQAARSCVIHPEVLGSDHCPVILEIDT